MDRIRLELTVLLYIGIYIPYIALTRWLASTTLNGLAHPLKGLEIVPSTVIMSWTMLMIFFWLSGWQRHASRVHLVTFSLPRPTRWTLLSGIATGLILVTVPLSFTFEGVSIPFVQLLMRGDILVVAPLVDLMFGRRVRWYSWVALALTGAGLYIAVAARGGLTLPPLCWMVIALYTAGYFLRLFVMTRIAKSGAEGEFQRYYVEEQLVGSPVALAILAALSLGVPGQAGATLRLGFVGVWTSSALIPLAAISFLLFCASVLAASILLNRRENSYCVPLERSASILAGVAASFILAQLLGQRAPTAAEMSGAGLLVLAITLLTLAPRLGPKVTRKPSPQAATGG